MQEDLQEILVHKVRVETRALTVPEALAVQEALLEILVLKEQTVIQERMA